MEVHSGKQWSSCSSVVRDVHLGRTDRDEGHLSPAQVSGPATETDGSWLVRETPVPAVEPTPRSD